MEAIVERMHDLHSGVMVRTVKSFISKIPSVFTGTFVHLLPIYISIYLYVEACMIDE